MVTKQKCEEAINEICKKCFEKHELEYGHQPVNCAFREFDNEDCPTVKVLKDLIQEHFEEKTETNLEIYFDDIGIFGINGFAVVNGKPMRCKDVHCDKCDFGGHCGGERLIWLASPYKKPPYKLSQFEYDLIQTYSYVHEGYTLSKFKRLIKLKDKGYFKCADYDTKIQDILSNCEVIKQ